MKILVAQIRLILGFRAGSIQPVHQNITVGADGVLQITEYPYYHYPAG